MSVMILPVSSFDRPVLHQAASEACLQLARHMDSAARDDDSPGEVTVEGLSQLGVSLDPLDATLQLQDLADALPAGERQGCKSDWFKVML